MLQSTNPQIFLEPKQYKTLQQIAEARGSSVVAVVQEVVQLGIETLQKQQAAATGGFGATEPYPTRSSADAWDDCR